MSIPESEQKESIGPQDFYQNQSNTKSKRDPKSSLDWAQSGLREVIVNEQSLKFNPQNDPRFYREDEMDYIINMIQYRQHDFEKTEMIKPLYNKAIYTLELLMEQLLIPQIFDKVALKYNTADTENTLRILLRCKMMFQARALMLGILQ